MVPPGALNRSMSAAARLAKAARGCGISPELPLRGNQRGTQPALADSRAGEGGVGNMRSWRNSSVVANCEEAALLIAGACRRVAQHLPI